MGIYNEKEVYVAISKNLTNDETIEFAILKGCATAYLLEHGCKAFGLPHNTIVVYKPRLIWDTQHRVKMFADEREDLHKVLLIYGERADGVTPEKVLGKMETISYYDFISMGEKEKDLLKKYLCMALPYNVMVEVKRVGYTQTWELTSEDIQKMWSYDSIKPYLRPMSSMTDEEKREFDTKFHLSSQLVDDLYAYAPEIIKVYCEAISWLLAHHFDFMGLIPMGLAIEITDKNNPYN